MTSLLFREGPGKWGGRRRPSTKSILTKLTNIISSVSLKQAVQFNGTSHLWLHTNFRIELNPRPVNKDFIHG